MMTQQNVYNNLVRKISNFIGFQHEVVTDHVALTANQQRLLDFIHSQFINALN